MNNSPPLRNLGLKSRLLWLAWVPLLIVVDQASKEFAVRELKRIQYEPAISLLGDTVRIQYAENLGAFGSLGAGLSETQRFWLLTVVNSVLLTGLLLFLLTRRNVTRHQFIAFGMILAGGMGNLIDRAMYGYVVDFLNVGIGWLRTNIFNVADMYITFGVVLLIPMFFESDPDRAADAVASGRPADGAS